MSPQTERMLSRYNDLFMANSRKRVCWILTLQGRGEVSGIPWNGSMVNMNKPTFLFRETGGGIYAIPYKELEDARQV